MNIVYDIGLCADTLLIIESLRGNFSRGAARLPSRVTPRVRVFGSSSESRPALINKSRTLRVSPVSSIIIIIVII